MARVPLREALAEKHVAQVAAAAGALNLDSLTVGVGQSIHGSRYLLVKRGPATAGIELII